MTPHWLFFSFLIFSGVNAQALRASLGGDVLVLGDQRWINATDGVTRATSVQDGILVGGADLTMSHWKFFFEARPELRALWSPSVASEPTSADDLSLKGPDRWAGLRAHVTNDENAEAYLDWERLALSFRANEFDFLVGRKIFSAGVLRLFPVWNKFSRPLVFLPSPLLLFGQDQATMNLQRGMFTLRAAYLPEHDSRDHTYWLEAGLLPENFELHFLASYWWRQYVYGFSAATDVAGATLRFESLFIEAKDELDGQIQMGLGIERSLNEKWTLIVELFYQNAGVDDSLDYELQPPTRYSPLRAKIYSAVQLSYLFSETLTFGASALFNHLDGSAYGMFKIDKSLTENSNVVFEVKGPLGVEGDEFSKAVFHFPNDESLGVPAQLSLSFKQFF